MTSPSGHRRVAIGPINTCGQAFFWAESVKQYLDTDAVSFAPDSRLARRIPGADLQGRPHISIPHRRLSVDAWRRRRMERFLADFSHVMVEGLLPVVSGLTGKTLGDDLPTLRRLDLKTAVILHGSEIRDGAAHRARHKDSYFSEAPPEWVEMMAAETSRNRRIIDEIGLPVFVSTPDLRLDVPAARWLPLSIDVDGWQGGRDIFVDGELPVVLHIPSHRNPPIKGTRHIEPVLEDFERRGLIRYLHPAAVPHHAMRSLVQSADIVVDQIMTGSYGVAAVEAMAAGRVVMGHIGEATLDQLSEPPPIVESPPSTFARALESILEDRAVSSDLGARGSNYARRWHDGRAAAEALHDYVVE